ncbi:MAG: cyclic nucleotide-binding domain-containing protein [Rhizobiaceae bacterium]|nr:cyclic nucleotide-binding domain-containing protein [Rhizobiaceae bacterium]
MSIDEEASALRRVPPFQPVSASRLKLLAFASEVISEPAGTTIIRQDQHGEISFILLDGTVTVEIFKDEKNQFTGEMEPFAFFGEIAVIRNSPRAATIIAKTDITLLKISKIALNNLMDMEPGLAERIDEHIESRGYHL